MALALLERSLQMLVNRHELLRTAFAERDLVPIQFVMRTASARLRVIDLAHLPEAERADAAVAIAREEARRPFDMSRPPLLRVTLIRLDPGAADLLVTTHSLAGDFRSSAILVRELAEIYDALHDGLTPALPEYDLQFGDYANWQEAWLQEGGAEEDEAYWERQLADLPAFSPPADQPLPAEPGRAGDIIGIAAPIATIDAAHGLARKHGATFLMLGVAAMATVLHRWTGATDVVFGTQVAGRDDTDLQNLVGPRRQHSRAPRRSCRRPDIRIRAGRCPPTSRRSAGAFGRTDG